MGGYTSQQRDIRTNILDKQAEAKKKSKIYNTQIIDKILEDLKSGEEPDMSPFWHGQIEYKDVGIVYDYTPQELAELEKCSDDIIYFVENYAKFRTESGHKLVKLRDYQYDILHLFGDEHWDDEVGDVVADNRYAILMQSRQTGKTTTTSAFFLWYMLFHQDKNCIIVANKGDTAREILDKIKEFLVGLPFFMKPGIRNVSSKVIKFENGCSIKAKNTNKTSATGDTVNVTYIDECAHIPANIAEPLWRSIKPTMSSFKNSQLIITSTPNGRGNLFERLYTGALKGINSFHHLRVDWWRVPGHDQAWAAQERIDFGEENFDQEYGLQFDVQSSMLLSAYNINFMMHIKHQYKSVEFQGVPKQVTNKIFWHPDFHPDELTYNDLLYRRFLFSIDTAQGKLAGAAGKEDADYNIINIFEIELLSPMRIQKNRNSYKSIDIRNVIQYRQIGIYMDNDFDEEQCAEACKYLTFNIFKSGYKDIDNVRILIEINFNGKNWLNKFTSHPNFYGPVILKTAHSNPLPGETAKLSYGYRANGGMHGKNYYCELGAKMIDDRQIVISQYSEIGDMSSITQLQSFCKNKKGHYEGNNIHDDISVTILSVSRAQEIEMFRVWVNEWLEQLTKIAPSKKIMQINRMLEIYVEEEVEVTDQQFSQFFNMVSKNFGKLTRTPQTMSQSYQQQPRISRLGNSTPSYARMMSSIMPAQRY